MSEIVLTEDHRYLVDSKEYPGVTTVIASDGLMGFMPTDPWYLERGQYIHEATALYDQRKLDESALDPHLMPYLTAWKRFRNDTGYTPKFIERSFQHPIYKYCGTLDRNNLDIKGGMPMPWHVIQGAAYQNLQIVNLMPDVEINPYPWETIYLMDDGKYKAQAYSLSELRDGFKIFLAALALYNWKKLKGVIRP